MASIYLRGKTWWVSYRLNGETVSESLKTRQETKALRAKAVLEDKLDKGELERDRKVPFDVFLVDYEKAYVAAGGRELAESRKASWKADSYALRHFVEFCAGHNVGRLDKVTVALIEDYRQARTGEGVSDSTVNKDIRVLKCAWNWAKRLGHVKENPFALVKLVKIPEAEIDVLSPEEVVKLLDAVKGKSMYPLVATAIYAGLRLGELLSLEWANVDLKGGWIHVVNKATFKTKNRRSRKIPIAPELDAILRPLAKKEGHCFMTREGLPHLPFEPHPFSQNVGQRLTDIGRRLKIYVTPHVLRKTFGTILLARDVPIERISAWLGHSSIAVTQKWYARHTLDAGREHIKALSFAPKAAAPVLKALA